MDLTDYTPSFVRANAATTSANADWTASRLTALGEAVEREHASSRIRGENVEKLQSLLDNERALNAKLDTLLRSRTHECEALRESLNHKGGAAYASADNGALGVLRLFLERLPMMTEDERDGAMAVLRLMSRVPSLA